ncbi:MAG: 16S rRNA (guanine(966)-N(2))-methyltransferase RsmD [bacterium]|nr:16S rRNA (guanine(966)-N(2))-methyltransferase RsmD [bacterium]
MRVVAGQWRGRKLLSPKGDRIRPTTDRVKEAMFSILGPDIRNTLVLDLCCGAGGLAIESLSRGACEAILVDSSQKSLDLARRNLEMCGADPESYQLIKSDSEAFFAQWLTSELDRDFMFLCDPPYDLTMAARMVQRLLAEGPLPGFLAAIVEHSRPETIKECKEGFWKVSNRQYGETCLSVIKPRNFLPIKK